MVKLTEKEAQELFRQSPTPQEQYDHPIGPEREEPSHQETAPARSAARTARPVQQNNDLPFASVGAAIVHGGKTAGKVLRSIPRPSWINTRENAPAAMRGRDSSTPAWLNNGISLGAPEWMHQSKQRKQPKKPSWIKY